MMSVASVQILHRIESGGHLKNSVNSFRLSQCLTASRCSALISEMISSSVLENPLFSGTWDTVVGA